MKLTGVQNGLFAWEHHPEDRVGEVEHHIRRSIHARNANGNGMYVPFEFGWMRDVDVNHLTAGMIPETTLVDAYEGSLYYTLGKGLDREGRRFVAFALYDSQTRQTIPVAFGQERAGSPNWIQLCGEPVFGADFQENLVLMTELIQKRHRRFAIVTRAAEPKKEGFNLRSLFSCKDM